MNYLTAFTGRVYLAFPNAVSWRASLRILILAILTSPALARPGETITQWKKRFPLGWQTPADEVGVYVQLDGRKSDIKVKALSQKNFVIYECYSNFVELRTDIERNPVPAIEAILKSLSDGKPWTVVVEQPKFLGGGMWTFGAWTAHYEDSLEDDGKLHVYTAQWPACKLRNTHGWEHFLPIDRKEIKAPPPKLGL
jgi:hypothetical protein